MKIGSTLKTIAAGALLAGSLNARAVGTTNFLQWSFTGTSGTVIVPVLDTSGFATSHSASNIIGAGAAPSWSSDIPGATQFCSGVGSVSFPANNDSGLSTGPLGTGNYAGSPTMPQIVAAGGLTMEVWVKNPAVSSAALDGMGAAFQWAGEHILGVNSAGRLGYFSGDNTALTTWSTTNWSPGQWIHLAVVLAQPRSSDSGAANNTQTIFTNVTCYVNGTAVASSSLTTFYRTRNISAGMHQGFDPYTIISGLIYEPRMTLGALNPSQFTIYNPPTVALVSPTNGQVFSQPANIPLSANVTSNGYAITQVNYYNGATLVASNTTSPAYSATWSNVLSGSYTLTAVAVYGAGSVTSSPVSVIVNSDASIPTFNPPAGGYIGAQSVAISSATPSAIIYYTMDSSTPTTNSSVYGAPIVVPNNSTMTIKAFATKAGYTPSPVATASYTTASTATWTNLAGGSWASGANWLNGIVGNGKGATNYFNSLTLIANNVLTFDSSPTVGAMIFGDQGSNYNWTINAGTPAGTLTLDAATKPVIEVDNQTATLAAAVAGTNGLLKTGAGQLTLSGVNSGLTGGATVSAGTLQLNSSTAAGPSAALITLNDANTGANAASLNIGSAALANPITVANHGAGPSTIAYTVSGSAQTYGSSATFTLNRNTTITAPNLSSGSYVQFTPALAGSGNLTLSNTAGARFILVAASPWSSFTGNIDVQNAAIFEPRGVLANSPDVTVETGGELRIQFSTATIGGLYGAGQVDCRSAAATLVLGAGNRSGNFSGILQNNGNVLSLTKTGTGTQILSGANNYTGPTTVSAGTLEVDSPGSLTGTIVTVQNGATLAGNGAVYSTANITSGGTLAVNTLVNSNALTGTVTIGALTLNAGCTNFLRISKSVAGTANDAISGTSANPLNFAGATLVVAAIPTDGTPLALNDTFTLFTGWTGYSGNFNNVSLPALPSGLSWDTSQLASSGVITVANVAGAPVFNPPTGTYVGAQTAIISSSTPGATIYYTLDGSNPTTNSLSGITPVSVNLPVGTSNLTINAYTHKNGYTDSAVTSATYSVPEAVAVWINEPGYAWSSAANWTNNVVPNNIGATVDFSQLTLTGPMQLFADISPVVGNLIFGDQGANYTTALDSNGGTITLNAGTNRPTIAVLNQTASISATVAGGAGLTKTGNGTLLLSGANTYTGGSLVSRGTLEVGAAGSVGADAIILGDANTGANAVQLTLDANAPNPITVSSNGTGTATIAYSLTGTFQNAGLLTLNRPTTITATNEAGTANLWGGIAGNVGTLTINGPTNGQGISFVGQVVGGSYTFTGTVALNSGILQAVGHGLGGSNPVVMNEGTTLYLPNGYSVGPTTMGSLNGSGTISIANSSGTVNNQTLALGYANGTGTFAGTIADGAAQLSLTKAGSGTQTLGGTNTYMGLTTISNGTLRVDGSLAAGSAVSVESAGTLGGTGTVNGSVTVHGTVSPGDSVGQLTTGAQTWYDGSTLIYQVASADTNNTVGRDLLTINGNLDLERTNNGVFTIKLVSMADSTTPGNVPDFNASSNYTWTVGTATGLVNPGNLTYITVDASAFSNTHGGTFTPAFDLGAQAIQIQYTASSVSVTPPHLTNLVSGGNLNISWPADHLGWRLETQTNPRSTGLSNNWVTVPGSTNVTSMNIPINTANPTVFYRLVYP
jgi:autotransporter-associated beta strand protein